MSDSGKSTSPERGDQFRRTESEQRTVSSYDVIKTIKRDFKSAKSRMKSFFGIEGTSKQRKDKSEKENIETQVEGKPQNANPELQTTFQTKRAGDSHKPEQPPLQTRMDPADAAAYEAYGKPWKELSPYQRYALED